MAEAFGWRSSCLAFALLICLVGLPLMWRGARSLEAAVDEAETQPAEGAGGQRAVSFLRRPALWLLAIAFALLGPTHSAIRTHSLRPEQRRVGKECVNTCDSRRAPEHQ